MTVGELIKELARFDLDATIKVEYFDFHNEETYTCRIEEVELDGATPVINISEE